MKVYAAAIEGISPLLMHKFSDAAQAKVKSGKSSAVPRPQPEKDAEDAAYRLPGGELYQPAEHIERSMYYAAKFRKIGTRNAATTIAGAVFVQERAIPHGTKTYKIDSRPVVIPRTKGRVIRYRPRLDKWRLKFHIESDEDMGFDKELVYEILTIAGKSVGVGDFRPQRGGSFGRFIVTKFEEVDGK